MVSSWKHSFSGERFEPLVSNGRGGGGGTGTVAPSAHSVALGLIVWIFSQAPFSLPHHPFSLLTRQQRGRSPNLKLNDLILWAFLRRHRELLMVSCMVRPCQWRVRVSEICQV
jgi:hypothetical protein